MRKSELQNKIAWLEADLKSEKARSDRLLRTTMGTYVSPKHQPVGCYAIVRTGTTETQYALEMSADDLLDIMGEEFVLLPAHTGIPGVYSPAGGVYPTMYHSHTALWVRCSDIIRIRPA